MCGYNDISRILGLGVIRRKNSRLYIVAFVQTWQNI